MSIIFEQFPGNPGNDINVSDLLDNIRNLYANTKLNKYRTIANLRKITKLDSYESRKLNSANSFKDRSDSIKSNLGGYVDSYKNEIESFLREFDTAQVFTKSEIDKYLSKIDYLRDNNKISNKDYNEAQLYFNFINDYIAYMEGKKGELKDGRFSDLNDRYDGNDEAVFSWITKMESLYSGLVNIVVSHKTAKDEFGDIQRGHEIYINTSSTLINRYNSVITKYNQMIEDLNNVIGNGPGELESEIAALNSEVDALQIEISAIQAEIDAYNAQLDPLYAERDAIQEVKLGFYNQWIAAKDAILVPLAEKQSQVGEYQYLAGPSSPIWAWNNTISPGLWQLKDLCQIRDGRPLRDYEIADLAAATASLAANTSQLESLQAAKAQHLATIDEVNTLRDLTLAIPAGRSLTTAEQDLVMQYTASIESPSTPAEDLPGLTQARQLILDIVAGRPLSEDVLNIYGVSELSFVGQGQWPDAYADFIIGGANGAIWSIDNQQMPGIQFGIMSASSSIFYINQVQNGRQLVVEEQIQYAEYAANFNSAFGYHEEITEAIVQNEIDQYISGYQSLIDPLNVEIADLQAIVTQYTIYSELDSLPNADGVSYLTLLNEQSDLWDAKDIEIQPIFNLRAPFLVTLEEKNSEVSSRTASIAAKQSIIDDIDNAEVNIVKVTDALAVVSADKAELDSERYQHFVKVGESATYYTDIISDYEANYDQFKTSIDSLYAEMDNAMFLEYQQLGKSEWFQWKKSEIRLANGLEDSEAFLALSHIKEAIQSANSSETNFKFSKSTIFAENSYEADLYSQLAYAGSDLYNSLTNTKFEEKLVYNKNVEFNLRIQLADQLVANTNSQAAIDSALSNFNSTLTQFYDLNPATMADDFNSVYSSLKWNLYVFYSDLKNSTISLYQGERLSTHLNLRILKYLDLCDAYRSGIDSYLSQLNSAVSSYNTAKTNLINALPGSSGSDILGDRNKLQALDGFGLKNFAVNSSSPTFDYKQFDSDYIYRANSGYYLSLDAN